MIKTTFFFDLSYPDDSAVMTYTREMPFKMVVGDRVYVDGHLWESAVEQTTFNLLSGCLEVNLGETFSSEESEHTRLINLLVRAGWEKYPI